MKSKFAVALLSTLLYAQGLLGFAVLASVLMHGKADAAQISIGSDQR
jgi:hypothetical protein